MLTAAPGSSPLARGLPRRRRDRQRECRDHPRSRGVYWANKLGCDVFAGSSPLARGLRMTRPTPPFWTPDHPRSRGVYPWPELRDLAPRGSSPLARGLQVRTMTMSHSARIIPARAGFTGGRDGGGRHAADHPRSRGVYGLRPLTRQPRRGSSPLARGLRHPGHG